MTNNPNREQIEAEALKLFENAADMRLDLPEDVDYDLNLISNKLRLVSVYLERLSDILLRLTRYGLQITMAARAAKALAEYKSKELKASPEYVSVALNEKGLWLANQLAEVEGEAEAWKALMDVVSEIKRAVGERAQTMRRLDSDIRLHSKIYEAKVHAGATAPSSYTGSRATEDVDL